MIDVFNRELDRTPFTAEELGPRTAEIRRRVAEQLRARKLAPMWQSGMTAPWERGQQVSVGNSGTPLRFLEGSLTRRSASELSVMGGGQVNEQ